MAGQDTRKELRSILDGLLQYEELADFTPSIPIYSTEEKKGGMPITRKAANGIEMNDFEATFKGVTKEVLKKQGLSVGNKGIPFTVKERKEDADGKIILVEYVMIVEIYSMVPETLAMGSEPAIKVTGYPNRLNKLIYDGDVIHHIEPAKGTFIVGGTPWLAGA